MTTKCPRCGTPVRHIHDEPSTGIPITINTTPTTWTAALHAILQGRTAVLAQQGRGPRGTPTTTYWRITGWRIPDGPRPGDTIHTQHHCGTHDPPPPPGTATRQQLPDQPPY
jgi:hypothetical protein